MSASLASGLWTSTSGGGVPPSSSCQDISESNNPFEGPEKVLELWFVPVSGVSAPPAATGPSERQATVSSGRQGLRLVPLTQWEAMLSLVQCKIISSISNKHLDAYLLSESSMFIYDRQLVLKTCGTTTLLNALPRILEIAASVSFTVADVFYNRQNFFFPERQLHPHRSFADEMRTLDRFFKGGSAYTVGRLNGNHWNFYNAEEKQLMSQITAEDDVTFEMLMTNLDPAKMAPFYHDAKATPRQATRRAGLDKLFPDCTIDDHVFEPFGYSMNALVGSNYMTFHVTPQRSCSFASFETNIVLQDYTALLMRVLACFNPKRLIVTMLGNRPSMMKMKKLGTSSALTDRRRGLDMDELEKRGYKISDDILLKFEHYNLVFLELCNTGAPASSSNHTSPRPMPCAAKTDREDSVTRRSETSSGSCAVGAGAARQKASGVVRSEPACSEPACGRRGDVGIVRAEFAKAARDADTKR